MRTAQLAPAHRPIPVEAADLLRAPPRSSGPAPTLAALSRGLSVVALSGCAALVFVLARGPEQASKPPAAPKPAVAAAPAAAPAVAPPAPADVRLVYGSPDAARSRQAEAVPREQASPPPVQASAPAPIVVPLQPPVAPAPAPAMEAPVLAFAPAAPVASDPAPEAPASAGGVDLNTASLEQLNGLNAGMIGRAIVRGRPYAAPEDLVQRRILSRATFDRIKDQVAVAR